MYGSHHSDYDSSYYMYGSHHSDYDSPYYMYGSRHSDYRSPSISKSPSNSFIQLTSQSSNAKVSVAIFF